MGLNMQIILNGKSYYTKFERITIHELLSELNIGTSNFAIALNMNVIPSSKYHELWLNNNDNVEIVTAFQGG